MSLSSNSFSASFMTNPYSAVLDMQWVRLSPDCFDIMPAMRHAAPLAGAARASFCNTAHA